MTFFSNKNQTYIFDLQTIKTFDDVGGKKHMNKMGISFAVFLNFETNQMHIFDQNQSEQITKLLLSAKLIIGIKLDQFSFKVLEACTNTDLSTINRLDILKNIKKKIHFKQLANDIFNATLGIPLNIDYSTIPRFLKLGKNEDAKSAIIQTVQNIKQLYEFGKHKGYIYLNDQTGQRWKISVKW